MRERGLKVAKWGVALCLALFAYIIFFKFTHLALRCPFFEIFHLFCPGCGSTRLLLALLHGDIQTAFSANCLLFILLPFYLAILIYQLYRYICYNDREIKKPITYFLYFTIAFFVVFAIVRNIYPHPPLVPLK